MGFGPAISAVGTSLSLLSQIQGQKQDRALSEFNERELRRRATATRTAAVEEQFFARQDLKRTVARNLAKTGASGVRPTGSPFMANLLAIDNAARNIGIIGFNAEQEARGLESRADIEILQRKFERRAGRLSLLSTAIGGISSFRVARANQGRRKGTISAEATIP